MGLQWCPRDPVFRINDHVIRAHLLVPIEYQQTFEAMHVHIATPPGVFSEIIAEDDREVTTIAADPSLWISDDDPNSFEYRLDCAVHGVPEDTPVILMVEETWAGTCETFEGTADGFSVRRVLA